MKKITDLDDSSFQEFVDKNEITLVDFWAPWCGPCKMIAPLLDDVAKQYADRLVVSKVDVDSTTLAAKHGVRGIPTLLIFKNGKPVDANTGNLTRNDLIKFIEKHLT